jgi:HEPN domain-containing protein
MMVVQNVETKKEFRFIDALGFLSGGTLDANAQAFNPGAGREKGFFPYEFLTIHNYQTELQKSEPFTHESFYSSLKQSNISDEEYQVYLKESEKLAQRIAGTDNTSDSTAWCSRLEYLLYYNERDTEIMIPIIEGLIDLFWENKVDMLQNLSLSSCSNQTKYALAFRDFNIDEDYNVPTGFGFNLTENKWKRKVDSYRTQDERAGRDARKNVSVRDYAWACLEFQNGCYICREI